MISGELSNFVDVQATQIERKIGIAPNKLHAIVDYKISINQFLLSKHLASLRESRFVYQLALLFNERAM